MPPFRFRYLSAVFALAAGAALRLWFIHAFPQIQGDSLLYADIGRNWLTHGIYGRSVIHAGGSPTIAPTLVRLPGYPAFLALCFAIFGMQNYLAVLYLQVVIDLVTCLLIAAFVRRVCWRRAAMLALWLAALCPFTANYVAMPLTETLSIFCVALGLYAFAAVLERPHWRWMLALAFAWSYAALLRPDGALLAVAFFPALVFYGRNALGFARSLRIALFCGLLSVLPFAAWTLRNWRTFHVFQPLAPRYATDPGEFNTPGFQRWTKTWMADFASTYEIYWNVPGDDIDIHLLPSRDLRFAGRVSRDHNLALAVQRPGCAHPADRRRLCRAGRGAHPRPSLSLLCDVAPAAAGGYVASATSGDAQYRIALVAVWPAPRGNPHRLRLRCAESGLSLSGADRSILLAAIWAAMVAYVVLRSLLLLPSRRRSRATRWSASRSSSPLRLSPSSGFAVDPGRAGQFRSPFCSTTNHPGWPTLLVLQRSQGSGVSEGSSFGFCPCHLARYF